MKVKECTVPRIILKLDALQGRLDPLHVKIPLIKDEWKKRLAGHKGEVSLEYVLGFLDPDEYVQLHGVRLKVDGIYFQIDTLILSRKTILVMEVKNFAGTIYFDRVFNQLIQTKDGQELSFPDPLIQVSQQVNQLTKWLRQHHFPAIPIHGFVVISNDKTLIKTSSDYKFLSSKVFHKQLLPTKVSQLSNLIKAEVYTDKEVKRLIIMIKKKHEEANPPVLEKFKISTKEILPGVICTTCKFRPLIRMHGTWYCPKCKSSDKEGHLRALLDYELLIGPTLTNLEFRRFLNLRSRHVSLRLLKSLNLPTTGTQKGTTYNLTPLTKLSNK
ncbi:NERD domain-containing protein [Rossellomorea aquimaris]|uniref:nuclease-related domain-containing protein n=1 Tax=Rossellomorea aquimaris TaxID=189382 RepID=UPI001CD81209|nr:nuclease-related domain-containing protein [Rossellomorea aquimaris]MCA1055466.1 NERD domain-containing protein [Rossellomorea aquimaris]